MPTYYVKSGSGATEYAKNTAYSLGARVVPARADTGTNHLIAKRYVWECTTAGTTDSTNYPTWNASYTVDSDTETSSTAVFTCRNPGFSSGTTANWTFATIYLDYIIPRLVTGDIVYVSDDHAENNTIASPTWSFPSSSTSFVSVICADDSAAPPTATATTATITYSGGGAFCINGSAYLYGITVTYGSGNANDYMVCGSSTQQETQTHENMKYICAAIGSAAAYVLLGPSGRTEQRDYVFRNCVFKASASTSARLFKLSTAKLTVTGSAASLVDATGSIHAGLIEPIAGGANAEFDGVDLSQFGTGKHLVYVASSASQSKTKIRNCKLGASVALTSGTAIGENEVVLDNCDSSDTNYRKSYFTKFGTIVHETTIVKTSGASDGTTPISYAMETTASAVFPADLTALKSPEIVKWNETTTGTITVTVEYLHDTNAAAGQGAGTSNKFQNDEAWLEVTYLGTSGVPLGTIASSKRALIGTAADNSAGVGTGSWTTTGLTTPASGKVSVSFDPKERGYISARVFVAKASKKIYIDPLLTIT